jgi:hypothetical protein
LSEEKLAREAIARIRGWIEDESKARKGGSFSPALGVKFCGGCNPVIERGALAQAIREGLSGMVRWVPWEEGADLVLIINGCVIACAERAEVQKKAGAILTVEGNTVSEIEKNPSAGHS